MYYQYQTAERQTSRQSGGKHKGSEQPGSANHPADKGENKRPRQQNHGADKKDGENRRDHSDNLNRKTNMEDKAYRGGFKAITWNAQALLSLDPHRRERKRKELQTLANKNPDFILLQELHSTMTAASIWEPPSGYRAFFSHGSASSAGVGIIVATSFLSKFDSIKGDEEYREGGTELKLEDIVAGRVARLRLDGKEGALEIFTVYLTTGDAAEERANQRRALAAHLPKPHEARAVMGGGLQLRQLG